LVSASTRNPSRCARTRRSWRSTVAVCGMDPPRTAPQSQCTSNGRTKQAEVQAGSRTIGVGQDRFLRKSSFQEIRPPPQRSTNGISPYAHGANPAPI
jgi:hypothetical protein